MTRAGTKWDFPMVFSLFLLAVGFVYPATPKGSTRVTPLALSLASFSASISGYPYSTF
jgi:hypothetical protein